MNLDNLLNSKFWEHLTLPKVILYIFTLFCVLFYFKAETIAEMWANHDNAKYGVQAQQAIADTVQKLNHAHWSRIRDLRHQIDSLKDLVP